MTANDAPKRVLLMRHAKSSWDDDAVADHDRDLNQRGLRTAPLMGQFLAEQNLLPDFVWCSTARRAQRTLQLTAASWNPLPVIQTEPSLYLARAEVILGFLRRTSDRCSTVMVIGHNPGMENLCGLLAGERSEGAGHFPTAAVAVFELRAGTGYSGLARETCRLRDFLVPKRLFADID